MRLVPDLARGDDTDVLRAIETGAQSQQVEIVHARFTAHLVCVDRPVQHLDVGIETNLAELASDSPDTPPCPLGTDPEVYR